WEILYDKAGSVLATSANSTQEYTNPAVGHWRAECVDLSNRFGQNLFVKFIATNGYGNNIYLDDITMNEVDCNGQTQVLELNQYNPIQLYPNPANETAMISIPAYFGNDIQIVIYNALGQTMQQFKRANNGSVQLELNSLSEGFYQVRVEGKNVNQSVRLVVKH
ncbi:MAG: T9SS type A sorting domain-containing protein, partial [Bacteroidetes bacterium]|nr:T9SS type A sorting domain-containing protein [Bacteroidota bacterium]